jgi:hypothetical protein
VWAIGEVIYMVKWEKHFKNTDVLGICLEVNKDEKVNSEQ